MFGTKPFVIVTLLIGSAGIAGCPQDAARPAQLPLAKTNSIATPKKTVNSSSLVTQHAHRLRRDAPRQAFLTTYNNPEQGISFRYPRNYALEEGDVQEHSYFLKRQEDLDNERPGAVLLATVLIPEDGYPNTTFEHGSLQLVVSDGGSKGSCRLAHSGGAGLNGAKLSTLQGVVFAWRGERSITGGTELLEREYTAYYSGRCYEFFVTVAAEGTPDPEGFRKPADTGKILRQLERIISSMRISAGSTPPDEDSSEESAARL